MKRILKHIGLVLLVLIVAVGVVLGLTFGPMQKAPQTQQLGEIHFVSDGTSTTAIVPIAPQQVLLVDSGMDAVATNIREELDKMGLSAAAVSAIVFTHGHRDHIGGAASFAKAQLIALAPEVPLITGQTGAHGPVTRLLPITPTGLHIARVIKDGEVVTLGQTTVKAFAIPGHTTGSAAYLINGVLFMGDSADATGSGKLQSGHWIFSDSIAQNEASLRALEQRLRTGGDNVQAIAFGHSGVLQAGLAPLSEWAKAHPGN